MKNAVIYARYSSDRQTEQSIEGQVRDCKSYAEEHGITIVGTYIDRAMSGTNDDRDDFRRMLSDSDKRLWDYVLVYKLDRFSRNKYETAIHRKHLADNGVKILSVKENIPDSPEGILLESLIEGMNQYYSEELAQKTRRGQRESRLKGHYSGGRLNYGYYAENKRIKINEDEACVVKEIFQRYANGDKGIDIERDFDERGITYRGKPFKAAIIYTILHAEKYTGNYVLNGVSYDNLYPKIIEPDLFDIVKKKIDANRYGKHVPDVSYLLHGKAYCGYCGTRLTSYTGTSKTGRVYRYYKCYNAIGKVRCPSNFIGKDILDNIVVDVLMKIISDENNLEFLVDKIYEEYNKDGTLNSPIKVLEKELLRITKSISNVMTAIENGIFTDSTKQRLEELETAKKEIENKLIEERINEKPVLTKTEIRNYLTSGIKQSPAVLIEYLVDKVFVFNDSIEIMLKYTASPPKPHNETDETESPDETKTHRGFTLQEIQHSYTVYTTKGLRRGMPPKVKGIETRLVIISI